MLIEIVSKQVNKQIGSLECHENDTYGDIDVGFEIDVEAHDIGNINEINSRFDSNDNVLKIDVDAISLEDLEVIKSIKSRWIEFETLRKEYDLGEYDDKMHMQKIIEPLKIYNVITDDKYEEYMKEINKFFEIYEEYDYQDLDNFLIKMDKTLALSY